MPVSFSKIAISSVLPAVKMDGIIMLSLSDVRPFACMYALAPLIARTSAVAPGGVCAEATVAPPISSATVPAMERNPNARFITMLSSRTPGRIPSCAHAGDLGHLRVVLAAPVLNVFEPEEIELDREPVRVLDEDLVEIELRQRARLELEAPLLETADEAAGLGGQEGDVVDDAGVVRHSALGRAQIEELGVVDAVRPHVDLDLAVHPEPVAGEGEGRSRHDLEAEHLTVEVLGLFEVVRPDEIVIELSQRHGFLLGERAVLLALGRVRAWDLQSRRDVWTAARFRRILPGGRITHGPERQEDDAPDDSVRPLRPDGR